MEKGKVMSQDDLYKVIRSNFGEVMEAGLGKGMNVLGKGMNVDTNRVTNVISSPKTTTTTITNGKSTVVIKDTEFILSGTRITIEGKATIHLDD